MAKLTESIRTYFLARRVSVRKLHLDTGIPRPTIANFRDGKPIHSDTLDKIAEYLGIELSLPEPTPDPPRKRSKA